MAKPQPLMTTACVARSIGVTPHRVQQMDAEFQPTRTASGMRLYDPAQVQRVAAARAAKAAR